ncbi:hypothetical protein ABES25_00005 [Bacillus gobiensis]|uniref:hypothetical protein n=1 Tax=Bacillus gobiensis TaxID=1441095 RepID=UPI003D242349
MEERLYERHRAFNTVYDELEKMEVDDFWDAIINFEEYEKPNRILNPLKYHHAPDKLKKIRHWDTYVRWFTELYETGQKLIDKLRELNSHTEDEKVGWYKNKKRIESILNDPHIYKYLFGVQS